MASITPSTARFLILKATRYHNFVGATDVNAPRRSLLFTTRNGPAGVRTPASVGLEELLERALCKR